jgi:hypothetical protein
MVDPVKNFAKVTVSIGYNAVATSIVLSTGDGALLPQPSSDGAFNLVWWNSTDYADPSDDPNKEIVRCTTRSTDTLAVTRAQEGTSASTKNTAGKTYKMILAPTAKMIADIIAMITRETPSGTINGSNNTFTLSHSPALTLLIYNGRILKPSVGYTQTGDTIVFDSQYIPQTNDTLEAICVN